MFNKEDLESEMMEWLLECFDDEFDQEQIRELNYSELVRVIDMYYDGGFRAFYDLNYAQSTT